MNLTQTLSSIKSKNQNDFDSPFIFTYNLHISRIKRNSMSVAEKLGNLRLILGHQLISSCEKQYLSAPQLGGGIVAQGSVVELLGGYKIEWLSQFLAQHPDLKVFWAERSSSILPTALHQRGVNLSQITFAILGQDFVQPLRRAMQSQVFSVVIAPQLFSEIKILQAFQLFAEKSNCVLFLLGQEQASSAWPISLQLQIEKGQQQVFEIEVLRRRHGKSL
jgi:hypothetical protein